MRGYPVKRAHKPDMEQIMKECFNNVIVEDISF